MKTKSAMHKFKVTDAYGNLVAELQASSIFAAETMCIEAFDMFLLDFYCEYNLTQLS